MKLAVHDMRKPIGATHANAVRDHGGRIDTDYGIPACFCLHPLHNLAGSLETVEARKAQPVPVQI